MSEMKRQFFLPVHPCQTEEASFFRRFWLGTWSLAGEGFGKTDLRESARLIDNALDAGVRFFDTAGFYGQGQAEILLGRRLKSQRKEVVISTKGGLNRNGKTVWHDGSASSLRQALETSLERLQTDYIDLFSLHWPDPATDLNESIGVLVQFQREGLIRFWGVCNLSAAQVCRYCSTGAFVPHQVHFNPLHPSFDILREGKTDNRCLNIVYSPLEQGLLGNTPKLLPQLGKKDVRRRNPFFHNEEIGRQLQEFRRLCDNTGRSPLFWTYLWIYSQPETDVIISGPKTPEQWEELIKVIREIQSTFSLLPTERAFGAAGESVFRFLSNGLA